MADEMASDEKSDNAELTFKVNVFIKALDTVAMQLNDRFSEEQLQLVTQMKYFTPRYLLGDAEVQPEDVEELCAFYKLDSVAVRRELCEFRIMYKRLHSLLDMNTTESVATSESSFESCDDSASESGVGDADSTSATQGSQWSSTGFTKPLRVLQQLSGFASLRELYIILLSLPVTSCSAERTMSKVRIVKNRLRTTMLDDCFSALVVLASERDILQSLTAEAITDSLAVLSAPLQTSAPELMIE
jgi:hypothetical protein